MVIRQGQLEDICNGLDVEVLSRKEIGKRECQGECAPFWPDNLRIKKLSELIATRGKRRATRGKLRDMCSSHGLSQNGGLKKLQKRLICHLCRKAHDKHRIERDLNMFQIVNVGFETVYLPHGQ